MHKPVLLNEILENLITDMNGVYFDGTAGFGGHDSALLNVLGKNAKLIACDKDDNAFNYCKEKFENDNRYFIYKTSFTNIRTIAGLEEIKEFNGIYADLGVSSPQLDESSYGFSYRDDSPLDMRMDKSSGVPLSDLLPDLEKEELIRIIRDLGEEKNYKKIVFAIMEELKNGNIETTARLKDVIAKTVPDFHLNKTLSRVFQAFRIFINDELEELKSFLANSMEVLSSGGRLAIISFHSLEDRIVKEFFRYEEKDCVCPPNIPICICDKKSRLKIITKKPIIAGDSELNENPRARSAKLRVGVKL